MIIAIPTETFPGERRVALTLESVQRLAAQKLQVWLQRGTGDGAWFSDDDYQRAGANVETSVERLLGEADVIAKIRTPSIVEVELASPWRDSDLPFLSSHARRPDPLLGIPRHLH